VLVTHVDKASKFLVAALGKDKSVKELNKVTINLFKEIDKNRYKPSPVINYKSLNDQTHYEVCYAYRQRLCISVLNRPFGIETSNDQDTWLYDSGSGNSLV